MAFSCFSSLASELQQLVMLQCNSGDLLRLAQSSRDQYALCLPLLYRHVDISIHNAKGLFRSLHCDCMVDGRNPDRYLLPYEAEKLQFRQEAFIDAIIRTPSLGALVLSLTWTYQWYEEKGMKMDKTPQMMWTAFKLLDRVRSLDICSFNWELVRVVPPPLFPVATSIRIGGKMTYAFFRAMISSPETVVSLDLDNPQGFGQMRDGLDEEGEAPRPSSPENISFHQETEDSQQIPVLRHPGAMRGHLNPLIGRFIKLKHLSIRTVGQDDSASEYWSEPREKERYMEISNFLKSVRLTLTTLVFEQGNEAELDPRPRCRADPLEVGIQKGRPMDTYFLSYVLPALVEGPWPKLKMLFICGVGGRPREWQSRANVHFRDWEPEDPAILESAEDCLRIALNHEVQLSWEAEFRRPFYLQLWD